MENIILDYQTLDSSTRDAIKTLRTNIQFASISKEIKSIVITSATPHEGKSTISCFLAMSMAEAGKKTLVVESDFRHTTLRKRFKLAKTGGVVKYLSGEATLDETIIETGFENLYLLDAESRIPNPVEIIDSEKYSELMAILREKFDIVIYDTPPLISFIDAALFAARADGTVMLAKPGNVEYKIFHKCLEQLQKANANVLGVVLNGAQKSHTGYNYYYGKYYKKYYSDGTSKKVRKKKKDEAGS